MKMASAVPVDSKGGCSNPWVGVPTRSNPNEAVRTQEGTFASKGVRIQGWAFESERGRSKFNFESTRRRFGAALPTLPCSPGEGGYGAPPKLLSQRVARPPKSYPPRCSSFQSYPSIGLAPAPAKTCERAQVQHLAVRPVVRRVCNGCEDKGLLGL